MKQQWRWSIVALVIIEVVLQGSGGHVDADVLQPRLAAQSPEFLRYEASAQSGGGAAGLGLVPSPVDRSYLDGEHVTWLGGDAPLPASYDLRTEGRVTGVRNQGTSNVCWAFAAYGSLESTMLPAETLDFSENNMKNTSGFDNGPNNWGNGDMATAYLARWSGPIAEAVDPYDQKSTTSPSGLSPVRHVQNVMILPKRPGSLDTADIKRALIDYGALVGSMCWAGDGWADTAYYKLNTGAYYYAGPAESSHVVAVVGWDDAFSASNFSTIPPGNGAWIVKNSWGTAWGQSGYFFISYYDSVLFKKKSAYCFQAAEPTTNYAHVYQYDPLGHTGSVGYGSVTAWEANVFVAAAAENVRAIGFYTLDVDCSYEVKVYGSWNGSAFSNLLSSTTGTIPSPGYHTIVLPSPGAPVASGQTFGVVVKMVTTNYRYPIALEEPIAGYSMRATAGSGQSYMSSNGTSWTDVTGTYANANVCVKAYAGTPSTTATLTCQASPAGAGSVSASPPSVDNTYRVGTVVTLTAAPAEGWRFVSWTDATQDATDPLKATVTMDAARSVTATFVPMDYGEPRSTHTWLDYPAGTTNVRSYDVDVCIDAFPSDPDPAWLYYFAIQTDFSDGGGGAHGGLQWASGGQKANWGGYDLRWAGDTQSIVVDQSWTTGTWYRYHVARGAQQPDDTWAWGFWITDLSTSTQHYLGDIYSKGSSISSCVVWMETSYGVVATTPRAQVRWRNPVYMYGAPQTLGYPVTGQATYNGTCIEPHTTDQQLISASPREWIQLTNAPVRTTPPSSYLWKDRAFTLTTTVSPSAGGSINRSPDTASYTSGTIVTLTAIPAAGYVFIGWSGTLSSTTNPATVMMDANKTVTASFAPNAKRVIQLKIGSSTMLVDGRPVVLEAAPIILNSRTLLPIRAVVEAVGGTIAWEASTRKVTIVRNDTTLELWIGWSDANLNGQSVNIDSDAKVIPIIMNGRTLLPLRFVAEALALDIQWNAATKTVTITFTP